jgi:YVTN family beta-propeller protein
MCGGPKSLALNRPHHRPNSERKANAGRRFKSTICADRGSDNLFVPYPRSRPLRKLLLITVLVPIVGALGWWYFREQSLPDYGPAFREYAYVTNGKSNTVSVMDLRTFALAKTIQVGTEPTGVAANSKKNEIYVVNTGSGSVSVIDAERNVVVGTISVRSRPYFIDVSGDGRRGYVANSGSNDVSVIDIQKRAVIGNIRVGAAPGLARVSPDGETVVVSNRDDNSVSLIDAQTLRVRATLPACEHPEDIAILPDSSKAFVSCSGSSQVASIALENSHAQGGPKNSDRVLALLDVGHTPVSLAVKPDGGELMVCNFDSDSISIIETYNDEVGSSPEIGHQPSKAVVTLDNSRLYVSNFGSNTVAVYDIDMGKLISTLTVGSHPDGLALTPDQNYLLVLDTQSGDVTVIQKRRPRKLEPSEYSLLTLIPVGVQPNAIVVKAFMANSNAK